MTIKSHLTRRRPSNQAPGRIDPREVAPSRHAIFIRNVPHNIGIEKVRSYFCDETDSEVTVDFYGTSEDKRYLFVALRFESHALAREMKEKYNNQRIFGNTVTISWFKNLKKERDKRIAMGIMPPLPVRGGGHYSSMRGSGGSYYRTSGGHTSRSHHNSMSSSRHRHDDSRSKRYGDDTADRDEEDRASSRSRRHSGDRRYSSDSYSGERSASRSRRSGSLRGSSANDDYSHDGRSHSRRSGSHESSHPPKKRSRRVSPSDRCSSRVHSGESCDNSHSREIRRKEPQHRVGEARNVTPIGSNREMSPCDVGVDNKVNNVLPVTSSSAGVSITASMPPLSMGGGQVQPTEKTWSASLDTVIEKTANRVVSEVCSPQEAIRKKKNEIEMAYKKDCETFSVITKLLINKDRELEDRILNCLKEVLRELGQQCIQDLRSFIGTIMDGADNSAKLLHDS